MSIAETRPPSIEHPPVFLLAVDAYHRMIEAGIFDADDRVELINGEPRAMPPIEADHAGKNKRMNDLLTMRAGRKALVAVQDPLTLQQHSEPEPDLMLLRARDDFYQRENPTPADTLLVVEIADSSLRHDPEVKIPLYAAPKIPEVWLIDLKHQRLELFRDPGPDGYR